MNDLGKKISLLQWQRLGFLPSLWGSPTYRSAPMNSYLVGIPPLGLLRLASLNTSVILGPVI